MKVKTHKGTAKRMKVTATGKLIHAKAGKNHLRVRKGNSLRDNVSGKLVCHADMKKLRALLPYSA